MVASTHCAACLRLLRKHALPIRPSRSHQAFGTANEPFRWFSTAPLSLAANSPTQKTHPAASVISPKSDSSSKNDDPETSRISRPALTFAQEVRKRAPRMTETYVAYGVCDELVKECARQADYTIPSAAEKNTEIPKTKDGEDLGVGTGWWYQDAGLTPTFNNWAQITLLHMYLLTVRIRCLPPDQAPIWHQHLINHFSYLAEERMVVTHRIVASSLRNRYLKDLFVQWRGLTAAYDEGIVLGDAVLATAVWRNVFKGDEEVDLRRLGEVVSYMRSAISSLDGMEDEDVVSGYLEFASPEQEKGVVGVRSRMMDVPFPKEEEVKGSKDVVQPATA